jgi:Flp pilus assembly protein TadD
MNPVPSSDWDEVEEVTELIGESRYREALMLLRDLIKGNPRNAYAYHYLGVCLFEVGELKAARDAYMASLRLAPEYLGSIVALSHVQRMLGDGRAAVATAMAALEQVNTDPDALHAAGLAYATLGDRSSAVRFLGAFLESNPPYEVANEVRAIIAKLEGIVPSN